MQGDVEDIDGVVTVSDDGGGGDDPLPPATPASGSGSGSVPPTTPTTTPTSRSGLRPRDIRYDDFYERDTQRQKGICKVMVRDPNHEGHTRRCGAVLGWPNNKEGRAGTTNSVFGHLCKKHPEVINKIETDRTKTTEQANLRVRQQQVLLGSTRADDIALYFATSSTAYRSIENIFFRRAFSAALVPKMKTRGDVRRHMQNLATRCTERLLERLRHKDVYLAVDCCKINKQPHLNFNVSTAKDPYPFHWKSSRLVDQTVPTLTKEIAAVIKSLWDKDVLVCAVVADNAKSLQSTMERFGAADSDSDEDEEEEGEEEEEGDDDEGEDDEDEDE
eukprot:Hpha_TRINITY_DN16881_c0_g1::TRINITY_DN16881_c0_g1_i1::g.149419::m.149419